MNDKADLKVTGNLSDRSSHNSDDNKVLDLSYVNFGLYLDFRLYLFTLNIRIFCLILLYCHYILI